jgi:ABC-type nitrate/sulfonate/bicarbonate transport system ATPase subunit
VIAAQRDPFVALASVSKTFNAEGRTVTALDEITFAVGTGEFVSVLGPSGCGKSTLLRLVAGLEQPDEGAVVVDGVPVNGPSLRRGIVFQDHRLFPWLTVEGNVRLGLLKSPRSESEKATIALELITLVGLAGFERAFPAQLSGGMAQRAAIARSLAARPTVLLLDEPFGALDSLTRRRMQTELLRIWQHEQVTMLLVTHDVSEALYLSDRIVVLDQRPGRVLDVISNDLQRPRSRHDPAFVALSERILQLLGAPS